MASKSTRMIRVRLPVEVLEIIERRVRKYPGEMSVSRYVSMRMTYDVLRKHVKHEDEEEARA